jgi:hypothetical protein
MDLEINKFIKNRSLPIENSSIENSSADSTINQTFTNYNSFEQQKNPTTNPTRETKKIHSVALL